MKFDIENIAFYYMIEICEGSDIPDIGEFVSHKDNCNVVLGWIPVEELTDVTIYCFLPFTVFSSLASVSINRSASGCSQIPRFISSARSNIVRRVSATSSSRD